MTLSESAKAYEVEPSILGANARIDDPTAAAKREFERRRKASLPQLSAEEVAQHTRLTALRGDIVGAVPRVDLRRNRYNVAALYEAGAAAPPVSPIVHEAAGRAYTASLRAVGYGSLLTLTSITFLAAYTLQQHGVTDTQALRCVPCVGLRLNNLHRDRMQTWMAPFKASMQQRMQPIKEYVESVAPNQSASRSNFAEELARVVKR